MQITLIFSRKHMVLKVKCSLVPAGDYMFCVPEFIVAWCLLCCLLPSFETKIFLMIVWSASVAIMSYSSHGNEMIAHFVEVYHCDLQCHKKHIESSVILQVAFQMILHQPWHCMLHMIKCAMLALWVWTVQTHQLLQLIVQTWMSWENAYLLFQ